MQVQAVWRQWQAAQAAPLPPTFGSPAAADVQPALRLHRLPELTSRLAQVLAPSVKPDSSPAAGVCNCAAIIGLHLFNSSG